jgi:predicted nucleic acid-binding protein
MSVYVAHYFSKKSVSLFLAVVIVMSDASILIGLAHIGKIDLLRRLIYEEKARKSAVLDGFNIMGIVGVLMFAKRREIEALLASDEIWERPS